MYYSFYHRQLGQRDKGGHLYACAAGLWGRAYLNGRPVAGLCALAGKACSTASCGFARNLRKDMFYKIQGYSFENIDKFSVSSLVTRLTTDITNVQMAYMMIIRTAVRSPLMLIFSFAMGFIMGGKMAFIFLFTIPVLGIGLFLVTKRPCPCSAGCSANTMP